jgi:hypothetical protein
MIRFVFIAVQLTFMPTTDSGFEIRAHKDKKKRVVISI